MGGSVEWNARSPRFWVLLAAGVNFALGAFLILLWFSSDPSGLAIDPALLFGPLTTGLAAGISGALWWWLLIERPSKPTDFRGVVFGVLTVLFAFPLWFFLTLPLIAFLFVEPGNIGVFDITAYFDGDSLAPLILVVAVTVGSVIATPFGIVAGLVLVVLRRRSLATGDAESTKKKHPSRIWTILVSATAFVIGLLTGRSVVSAIAAAFTSALFWWLIIERSSALTYRQGARFGLTAQLTAFPVTFLLSGLLGVPVGGADTPTFEPPPSDITGGAVITGLTFFLMYWMWEQLPWIVITGLIGVSAGLILVALRQRYPIDIKRH